MNGDEKLTMLKNDLQMTTKSNDDYLSHLLSYSGQEMERMGIRIEETIECDSLQIMYAAYLFRKRAGTETNMPRFLRIGLNNLLLSQKGRTNDI